MLGWPRSGGLLGLTEANGYATVRSRSNGAGVVFLAADVSASQPDASG
jgi:hypothetical protein